MLEEILLGIVANALYDSFKKGMKLTATELSKITKYSYNDCDNIISSIKLSDIHNKDDVLRQLENSSIIKNIKNNYYNTNFSIRLDYIISKMAEFNSKANIEWLCNKLGYSSSNELLKYYKNSDEPTFEFLNNLSNNLGINTEWLQYGEDDGIFETVHLHIDKELLKYIKSNKIDTMYFAFFKNSLSAYDNSELIMVFKFNELKYVVNSCYIPFGSYVGGTGTNTICHFYGFLLWLKKNGYINKCKSISINSNTYNELVAGKLYGKAVENSYYHNGSLGELVSDFVNINSNIPTNEQKLNFYGQSFLDCQEIINSNTQLVKKAVEYLLNY